MIFTNLFNLQDLTTMVAYKQPEQLENFLVETLK